MGILGKEGQKIRLMMMGDGLGGGKVERGSTGKMMTNDNCIALH